VPIDWVYHAPLRDGVGGVTQTLEWMAALILRDAQNINIREHALRIVSDCPGHAFQCEIKALFEYCRDQITYRRDPVEQERVADCQRTLESGVADCDDKVVCLGTLLETLGHRVRLKVLGTKPGTFSHVYLEVQTKTGWLPLDPTPETSPMGWEARGTTVATYEIHKTPVNPLLFIAGAALLYFFLR
jgi:hypothetical protein